MGNRISNAMGPLGWRITTGILVSVVVAQSLVIDPSDSLDDTDTDLSPLHRPRGLRLTSVRIGEGSLRGRGRGQRTYVTTAGSFVLNSNRGGTDELEEGVDDEPLTLESELTKGVTLNQSEWQGQYRYSPYTCKEESTWYWCNKNVWLQTLYHLKDQALPPLDFDPKVIDSWHDPDVDVPDLTEVTQDNQHPNMTKAACHSLVANKEMYRHCLNIVAERVLHIVPRPPEQLLEAVRNILPDEYSSHGFIKEKKNAKVKVEIPADFFKEVRCISKECKVVKRGSLDPLRPAFVTQVWLWKGTKLPHVDAIGWLRLAHFGNLSIQYNATEEDISDRLVIA